LEGAELETSGFFAGDELPWGIGATGVGVTGDVAGF
jgi:hypothetical protein